MPGIDPSEEFDELSPDEWELIHDHAGETGLPVELQEAPDGE